MSILIAGLGNVLRGDDAIGPTLLLYLQAHYSFPPEVRLEDLGTPGIDLARHLAGHETTVIIDAVAGPSEAVGTLQVIGDLGPSSSAASLHNPTLGDALRLAPLHGTPPSTAVLLGISCHCFDLGAPLSPVLQARLGVLTEEIAAILPHYGVRLTRRPTAQDPSPWWSVARSSP